MGWWQTAFRLRQDLLGGSWTGSPLSANHASVFASTDRELIQSASWIQDAVMFFTSPLLIQLIVHPLRVFWYSPLDQSYVMCTTCILSSIEGWKSLSCAIWICSCFTMSGTCGIYIMCYCVVCLLKIQQEPPSYRFLGYILNFLYSSVYLVSKCKILT